MVTKADISVHVTMTLEQADAIREALGNYDRDHITDSVYRAIDQALTEGHAKLTLMQRGNL